MGALTKAAVLEICEVVDEGYAVLQLEISRGRRENDDLRKKLHLIESIIVRGNGGNAAAAAAALSAATAAADGVAQQAASCAEDAAAKGDAEKTLPDVVFIKDEDSDASDSLKDGEETACSYTQHPEHLPHHQVPMGAPHYGGPSLEDTSSLLEGRGDLDPGLLWPKQSKLPYGAPFPHHEHYDAGDAFGLKLIGVTGSITGVVDHAGADAGHLSEDSSSAFDFEDCDGGSFG
ncbi:hypothetical protein CRUP_026916, partial [Coryphaenoides rupestris]